MENLALAKKDIKSPHLILSGWITSPPKRKISLMRHRNAIKCK